MAIKLPEYVQLEDMSIVQQEIKTLNYELVSAINTSNIINELQKEKRAAISLALNISDALLPEVAALNRFLDGGREETHEEPVKRGRGRPRKTDSAVPVRRGPGRPRKVKRGRGRPRKNPIIEEKPESELVKRGRRRVQSAEIDELKKNLKAIRQSIEA